MPPKRNYAKDGCTSSTGSALWRNDSLRSRLAIAKLAPSTPWMALMHWIGDAPQRRSSASASSHAPLKQQRFELIRRIHGVFGDPLSAARPMWD